MILKPSRHFKGLVSLVILALGTPLPAQDAEEWTFNPLLGWVYSETFPWVWSDLGWQFLTVEDPRMWDQSWAYIHEMDWYWATDIGEIWVFTTLLGESGFLQWEHFTSAIRHQPLILGEPDDFPAELTGDPFTLNSASFAGETLTLEVSYSGGCKDHFFFLITDGLVEESFPPQVRIFLVHNGNDDMCEALITRGIQFDLAELLDAWKDSYNEMILRINPSREWGRSELHIEF